MVPKEFKDQLVRAMEKLQRTVGMATSEINLVCCQIWKLRKVTAEL